MTQEGMDRWLASRKLDEAQEDEYDESDPTVEWQLERSAALMKRASRTFKELLRKKETLAQKRKGIERLIKNIQEFLDEVNEGLEGV